MLALKALIEDPSQSYTTNCGYGHSYSVPKVLDAVDRVTSHTIERWMAARGEGDPDSLIFDPPQTPNTVLDTKYDSLKIIVQHALEWERKSTD